MLSKLSRLNNQILFNFYQVTNNLVPAAQMNRFATRKKNPNQIIVLASNANNQVRSSATRCYRLSRYYLHLTYRTNGEKRFRSHPPTHLHLPTYPPNHPPAYRGQVRLAQTVRGGFFLPESN
jgi:hypothetical protein